MAKTIVSYYNITVNVHVYSVTHNNIISLDTMVQLYTIYDRNVVPPPPQPPDCS